MSTENLQNELRMKDYNDKIKVFITRAKFAIKGGSYYGRYNKKTTLCLAKVSGAVD